MCLEVHIPDERLDVVLGHHAHSTQLPIQEKINKDIGFYDGFHITVRFKTSFKNISRKKKTCGTSIKRLNKMDIALIHMLLQPHSHQVQLRDQNLDRLHEIAFTISTQRWNCPTQGRASICHGNGKKVMR